MRIMEVSTITLTTKDADYVLNYLRTDLERLNGIYDKTHDKDKELKELYEKSSVLKINPLKKSVMASIDAITNEFDDLYHRKANILLKCIELLTVGSPDD